MIGFSTKILNRHNFFTMFTKASIKLFKDSIAPSLLTARLGLARLTPCLGKVLTRNSPDPEYKTSTDSSPKKGARLPLSQTSTNPLSEALFLDASLTSSTRLLMMKSKFLFIAVLFRFIMKSYSTFYKTQIRKIHYKLGKISFKVYTLKV